MIAILSIRFAHSPGSPQPHICSINLCVCSTPNLHYSSEPLPACRLPVRPPLYRQGGRPSKHKPCSMLAILLESARSRICLHVPYTYTHSKILPFIHRFSANSPNSNRVLFSSVADISLVRAKSFRFSLKCRQSNVLLSVMGKCVSGEKLAIFSQVLLQTLYCGLSDRSHSFGSSLFTVLSVKHVCSFHIRQMPFQENISQR